MTAVIDERRHFRVDDRVEFSLGKRTVRGIVKAFRLVPTAGAGEQQRLTVLADDGATFQLVNGERCKLIGRAEQEGAAAAPAAPAGKPIDLVAVATRVAKSHYGATLLSANDRRALALGYLAAIEALRGCVMNDRSAPYGPAEPRPFDGARPGGDGGLLDAWLTPREIAELIVGKAVP